MSCVCSILNETYNGTCLQGTLDQMAPEVLGCPDRADPQLHKGRDDLAYGTSADVWAVGALAHELLMGASPFARLTQQQMIEVEISLSPHQPALHAESIES